MVSQSQAGWASRFESSQGRRLRLEDELIRIQVEPERWEQIRGRAGEAP